MPREDAESPTAPEPGPALATTAATALVFYQLSAGRDHTCGVTTDNRAYCWGYNYFGQLGDGGISIGRLTPTPVAGGLLFRQLSTGGFNTCGATTDNKGYCWGYNPFGQLGDGGTTSRGDAPVAVAGEHVFHQISASLHTCAVTSDNRAFCWGPNFYGQLGDGTTQRRLQPRRVVGAM